VQSDGSLKICGYVTSIFEEHKNTRSSRVESLSYMAPEVHNEEHESQKV
jgi:hypothetical protein